MARFLKNREKVAGRSPGDLVFVGNKKIDHPIIRIMEFNVEQLNEVEVKQPDECRNYIHHDTVTWISVYGLHAPQFICEVGNIFNIHPLVLEDITNTGQRPKIEEYDDSLYLVLKTMFFDQEASVVRSDQISIIVGETFLLSFHEKPVDLFHSLRERIRKQKGRIRRNGSDYLAYTLLDVVVDHYMIAIEGIGSRIEDIEEAVLENPDQEVLGLITRYKREVNYLRKSIRPAREMIQQLVKLDSELRSDQTLPFWKDLLDLATQATEALETYREMLSDQLNTYNTSVSNKLNEIMKVLTIFAAIFIPLTFIAGIYGTNFEHLPELHYKYSYYIFWFIMILVAGIMIRFFKRKGWM